MSRVRIANPSRAYSPYGHNKLYRPAAAALDAIRNVSDKTILTPEDIRYQQARDGKAEPQGRAQDAQ